MRPGEERRKKIRIFLPDGKVRQLSSGISVLVGRALDISVSGVRFICETKVEVGEELDLEIVIPNTSRFKCITKVVHLDAAGKQMICGAAFMNLNEKEQISLGEYIMKAKANQDKMLRENL